MANLVLIKEHNIWINLDYVVRIDVAAGEGGSTAVTLADGSFLALSAAAARKLIKQLRPKKKKKGKKGSSDEAAEAGDHGVSAAGRSVDVSEPSTLG